MTPHPPPCGCAECITAILADLDAEYAADRTGGPKVLVCAVWLALTVYSAAVAGIVYHAQAYLAH